MQQPVKKIVIAGGGSAGWLTAAYALYNLPNTQITLIESPNVPIVGVGEATILGFDHYLDDCGISKELWTKECDATIKLGTYFLTGEEMAKTFGNLFISNLKEQVQATGLT